MSVHTGEKHFSCKHCPKGFRIAVPYHIHNLQHANTPEFDLAQLFLSKIKNRCYFCQKPFSRHPELTVHMNKVHTGETSFECKRCGVTFYAKHSHLLKDCDE